MTSDPITIAPGERVREALVRMRRHRLDHLPVSVGGQLLGVLQGAVLLERVFGPGAALSPEDLAGLPVMDLAGPPEAVGVDQPEGEAAERMRRLGATALPVVDGERLVGMIAGTDLFGYLLERISRGSGRRPAAEPGIRFHVLLGVARKAATALEISTILEEITRHLLTVIPVDRSALLLLPAPDAQEFVVHSTYAGLPDDAPPRDRVGLEGTLSGWVTLHRQSVKVDDLKKETRFPATSQEWSETMRSVLSAPLLYRGECLGVINVWCRRAYAYLDTDLELLDLVAGHIAAAVQNARRFEREQKLVAELREAGRIKDEFLAVVTHDLRNALQGILAYSQILVRRSPEGQGLREVAEDLHEAVEYMNTLTNDLHDLARLGMQAIRLHPAEVDLEQVVARVLDSFRELAREEQVELRPPGLSPPTRLVADPFRLRQVLANLVANAVKYNRPGGWVEVRSRREDASVVIEVEDSGVGIPPEHRHTIFDLFARLESSRKIEGSGLGLSITRQLVELHGGALEVDSTPGRGSTFRFRLPLEGPPRGA